MESTSNGSWRPWTGYVPTPEEIQEHDGSGDGIRRVHPNGWYRLEYPNGNVEVCHMEVVRILDHYRVETYSSGREGPVYDHGFYLPRWERITQDQAMAWFAKHKMPPPVMPRNAVQQNDTPVQSTTAIDVRTEDHGGEL